MKPFTPAHGTTPRRRIRTGLLLASTAMTFVVAGPAAANDVNGTVIWNADFNYGGHILVGNGTTGLMIVEDGAEVLNTSAFVGASSSMTSPNGEVIVRGAGSSWLSSGEVYVGYGSDGLLQVLDGGYVAVAGSMHVGASSGRGDVIIDGGSRLEIVGGDLILGGNSYGTVTVSGGSTLAVGGGTGDIVLGSSSSAAELNIGAGGGTVSAGAVQFSNSTSSLVFDHGLSSFTFDTKLEGGGQIFNDSGTTLLSSDVQDFAGTVYVRGGALILDNLAISGAGVVFGGALGGIGSLSGVMYVQNGATLAPGSSAGIGQLDVGGNVNLFTGSTYEVHVDSAGNADKVVSGGGVYIDTGVTLNVLAQNGTDTGSTYNPSTTYTILEAGSSLTGTFDTVNENFAYLDANVTYDATKAYLTLTRCVSCGTFASLANTPNQSAVAGAIESQGSGALYNAILALPVGEPGAAFEQLSGAAHASVETGYLDRSRLTRDVISNRLRDAFEGVGAPAKGERIAGYDKAPQQLLPRDNQPNGVWMSGFGAWGRYDGEGTGSNFDVDGGGVLFGGDRELENGWRLGVAGGYSRESFGADGVSASGSADSYHLAAYAGRRAGPLGLKFGAAYGWSAIETERNVAFTGFSDTLTADYNARTAQVFAETSWRIDRDLWHFEPFAGLAYVHVDRDGFTEQGGVAALTADAHSAGQWQSTLGVKVDRDIAVNGALGKVKGSLGWRHAFGDTATEASYGFATGDTFSVASAAMARDTALVGAGVEFELGKASTVSLSYTGQFGQEGSEHLVSGNLGLRF
ncbi:outer membrane autotransporter protein [Rhizobium rosettiformans]|uniref:Autotransporter domain-containing protein n=2 Tax=Rhizobium rosettiformans TaxID=1368430 RepID=A0A4S8Q1L0_9HYPH|nr:autotransporter domain-containing protein [Rhizobium rosettiformans]MBB5274372.1 outer membrane autotransporter protein [Rhizobium rosettiformans]THV38003.1 autotransporter domain-containing protein [Rhizobium rosettiformans W3]